METQTYERKPSIHSTDESVGAELQAGSDVFGALAINPAFVEPNV